MSDKDRDFVEQMDEEYFTRVKTSDDFYRRKKLILMNFSLDGASSFCQEYD